MKVIAFNGSARKDGNTAILVRTVLKELEQEGIECEFIQLAGQKLSGCIACYKCFELMDRKCVVESDNVNEYIGKVLEADGIILASPVYYADLTAGIKALIERTGMVTRANGDLLKRKVGAAVVVARRGGAIHAFDSVNHFFQITQMIIPGSNYWNVGIGREPGEVEGDAEGLQTMRVLGQNMAWLMKRLGG